MVAGYFLTQLNQSVFFLWDNFQYLRSYPFAKCVYYILDYTLLFSWSSFLVSSTGQIDDIWLMKRSQVRWSVNTTPGGSRFDRNFRSAKKSLPDTNIWPSKTEAGWRCRQAIRFARASLWKHSSHLLTSCPHDYPSGDYLHLSLTQANDKSPVINTFSWRLWRKSASGKTCT